jgi:membrane protease YdiL (CAAX protease family)
LLNSVFFVSGTRFSAARLFELNVAERGRLQFEAPQFEPSTAGNSYPAPTLLPPLVRFVVAAIWAVGVFWGSGFVYGLFPEHELIPGVLFRVLDCALTGAGFAFFLRVLDYNNSPVSAALGLPLDLTAGRQWSTGLALGALLITANVVIVACFGSFQWHFHLVPRMMLRFTAVAVLLLAGALMEELSFRGYPFQKLTEAFGAFWAVVVLSALFGAVHLWNPDAQGFMSWAFLNTIVVGLLFALARIRTGSLWFSFGLHFGWNLFQGAVFGLPVSGIRNFSSIVAAKAYGSPALTGGAYGPEASATCSIVLVIALPLLWWLTTPRQTSNQKEDSRQSGESPY